MVPSAHIRQRHIARQKMFSSTLCWAFGNAFLTASVVYQMVRMMEISSGIGVSLIFLTPWLAGIFRWFTPVWIQLFQSKKRFILRAGILEILFWYALLLFSLPHCFPPLLAYSGLLFFWLGACLMEHCSFVALLSWQGSLFPEKTRGRFFGILEKWKLGGEIAGLATTLIFTWLWRNGFWGGMILKEYWIGFPMVISGTFFLWRRLLILQTIPEKETFSTPIFSLPRQWSRLKKPFQDQHFRPMLLYGALFSFITQLDQVAQVTLPYFLVGWGFLLTQGNRFFVKTGQFLLGGRCGKWLDRWAAPRVILFSQYATAVAPLFYVLALERGWGWLLAGQVFWIFYVGLNIGLPQIQLQMADSNDSSPWPAAYGFVCGIFGCLGMLSGGFLWDCFGKSTPQTYYETIFTFSAYARLLATLPLCWLFWKWKKSSRWP
ncbi:MAG: hypothetical protein Q4D62_08655 [Planctomycetia bacterium]|nr:hypothetical protein [Planctomycetia bacterium]